ncbi:GMC oxidoreductase [Terrarubrum flagellatum]|uniref:GMC oxidoreductase n=1 Tax=Terrirubrum flagellatum TaxID=2895980 RepID=UPI00314542DF
MSGSSRERVDVVIVGSGPAGAAYARTLADLWPQASILMVEAGPVIADPPGLHVANIKDDAARLAAQIASQGPHRHAAYDPITEDEVTLRRQGGHDTSMLRRPGLFRVGDGPIDGEGFPASHASHNVGGMGSHWFCACPRPDSDERIPFLSREVMDEALTSAEKLLRVSQTQFSDSHIAEPLRNALSALFDEGRSPGRRVQPMPMAINVTEEGVYRTGSNVILGDLVTAPRARFELRPETVCRRILMQDRRATGVELFSIKSNETYSVDADVVIVAADSLHSPQLLFASGIRPPALGRYLNEHPQVTVLAEFEGVRPGGDVALSFGGGVLGDRTVTARMSSGVTWVPYNGPTFPFHVQISQVEPASLYGDDRAIGEKNAVLSISFFLPSDRQSENRVMFSETERDWLGRPKMSLRFKLSDGDMKRISFARETLEKICGKVGRMLPGHQIRVAPYGTSLHYQGTIGMGEQDDGASTCDRNSCVWGVDNVYVAGNGVIPTSTAANPTLTAVGLAILGARHIASTHRAPR